MRNWPIDDRFRVARLSELRRFERMLGKLLLISLAAACVGCSGDSPGTAPVKGVIHYQGQPLADANVSFVPAKGRPASGTTNAAGEFELTTFKPGDGAIPGEHQVIVQKFSQPASEQLYARTSLVVPQKYVDLKTTPLRQTVPPAGLTDLQIELQK